MLSESQNQSLSSFPRNHNITNAFYKAGFVESWGRGFKKIAEELEKAKLPLPTIEEDCGGVMAVIQRRTVDEIRHKKLPPKREYRLYTFGNYCLIVIRCRKSYFLLQIYNKKFGYPNYLL